MKSSSFVDIPVGDFKLSNLDEHPNLVVPNAQVLRYRQSDGQDLCVSKSLASVLHALQFESVATAVNESGEQRGGGSQCHQENWQLCQTTPPGLD